MKYSKLTLEEHKTLLDDYNLKQDSINRQESGDVKKCFTNQVHQTLMASTAILGVSISLMAGNTNWYIIGLTSVLLIALCLMTINVGCYKYNTSNRTIAYQIHLSRITDYEEINYPNETSIAFELRRIDWEEAMFAWRVIQPHIYNFFYKRHYRKERKSTIDYPWCDSKKLINNELKKKKKKITSTFYPGTYLRRMLYKLYFVVLLLLIIYVISIFKSLDLIEISTFSLSIILCALSLPIVYTIKQVIDSLFKCKKLESGLLSIQSSAFVWRIVCISLLLAKQESIKENLKTPLISQIYKNYTIHLAKIASEGLVNNIHRIHEWLGETEIEIIENMKILSKKLPRIGVGSD